MNTALRAEHFIAPEMTHFHSPHTVWGNSMNKRKIIASNLSYIDNICNIFSLYTVSTSFCYNIAQEKIKRTSLQVRLHIKLSPQSSNLQSSAQLPKLLYLQNFLITIMYQMEIKISLQEEVRCIHGQQ